MSFSLDKGIMKNNCGKKWRMVYEDLRDELRNGNYVKGDKFFSIFDICERSGVSSITAKRALNELANRKLIIQKQGVGSIINWGHNNEGRMGFFVADTHGDKLSINSNTIVFTILTGALERANREGIEVEYLNEDSHVDDVTKIILAEYSYYKFDEEAFRKKFVNSIPILLHTPGRIEGFHTVRHGLYEGAYCATKHLIEKGYRKIAFISGFLSAQSFVARLQGYLEALGESGLEFDRNFLKETSGKDKAEDIKAFRELEGRTDAVFCANDVRALNILQYCNKEKIRVPKDIAICGFDNISRSNASNPPLTTVDTQLKKLGERAIELAIKVMDGEIVQPQDIVVIPELIVRETT